jgi:hypothetical protein
MNIRLCMLSLAAAAFLAIGSPSAEAREPAMNTLSNAAASYYTGDVGYYTMLWRLYNTSHIPVPPYFALQPPVYYSEPVARPYGYGPYAYPRWIETPEPKAPVRPAMVTNPFVAPKVKQTKPGKDTTAQMIFNPYIIDAAGIASH